jgi:hypothetical protein
MKTLYSTRIRLLDLFAGYVQVFFIISWFNLSVPQAARQLQARLNVQQNLRQNLQRKFDDISAASQDGDDLSPQAVKKRRRTEPDDQPSVEEAQMDEVKSLGRRFVILYGPWLRRKELIFQVELVDNEDYNEKERFKDANVMVQGQLREIKSLLPEKYLGDAFTKKWLSKSVSNVCFPYKCTNCSISSSRGWTHNDPILLHASGNLPPPYSALAH